MESNDARRQQLIQDCCHNARDELAREIQEMVRLRTYNAAKLWEVMDIHEKKLLTLTIAKDSKPKAEDLVVGIAALNAEINAASDDQFPKRQKVKPSSAPPSV